MIKYRLVRVRSGILKQKHFVKCLYMKTYRILSDLNSSFLPKW